jgi:cytochrome bd-type quinol oxidase subunit 2
MINNFNRLKAILFLFIVQFSLASFIGAATNSNIKTDGMKAQDDALISTSGLAGNSNLATIMSTLIQVVLGFLGVIFLALTIMAGFKWMMSQGNEKEIETAKGSLKNAIIGVVIVLAAYVITYSVFKYLPFASNGTGSGGTNVTP